MDPTTPSVPRLRVIGPGRAGGSLASALAAAGWSVDGLLGRHDDPAPAAAGVDLLVLAVPDSAIAEVAARVAVGEAVVAHLAGSRALDVLAPHPRRASIHPLVSLPDPEVGARRLAEGAWFAVAGSTGSEQALAERVVADLGGRIVVVPDDQRAAYHAAACIASNHLVALLGQVERVAAAGGVPLEAYLALARDTVANVAALGPRAALTGPAARGDEETLARHRAALDPSERPAYDALAEQARRLARGAG